MSSTHYLLAIDVGTSRTAASTARSAPDGGLTTAAFGLGRAADSAPSAIFVSESELLFGEAAERRGLAQPERLVREFKRRIGDDVPIVVGDQRFAPEELYARMVAWVVDAVTEREGSPPAAISVTTPVTWGTYRSGLAAAALARGISGPVELITEPEAAARHYETTSPLEVGHAIAVYDLGGGTFDAVLLRKDADGGVRLMGEPLGIADFGGADFDDQVLRHVIAAAGLSVSELTRDPAARVALTSLRRECIEAKEALSFDSEAVVPVLVGHSQTTVRVTRAEFEAMIEPGVERTVDLLDSALDAVGMVPADLEAILLTGGSSRIPRIAQLLSERFDRPIAIDADPKAIVALGAARALADRRDAAAAAVDIESVAAAAALILADAAAAPPSAAPRAARIAPKRGWLTRVPTGVAVAGGAIVLAGGIVVAGATALGSGVRDYTEPSPELAMSWLGFSLAGSPATETAETAQSVEPVAAAPQTPDASAPSIKAPSRTAERPKGTPTTRTEAAPRPSRIPTADAPRTQTQDSTSTSTADPAPSDATPDDALDPTATDPTPDPVPDPTPSDPAPDPIPDPTPDPIPDPIPDPTPDPIPDPTPSDPPAPDPTPSDPPTPDPDPVPPAPEPEPEPSPLLPPEPEPTP